MRAVWCTLFAGSILAILAGVAFVTVIATGAAIPGPSKCGVKGSRDVDGNAPSRREPKLETHTWVCAALRLSATNSENLTESHQISQRPGPHFLHNVPAVYLHRDLGNADLRCYLFVHESGRDQGEYLPLTGGQGIEKSPRVREDPLIFASLPIAPDRFRHSMQHFLLAEWLA